MTIIKKYIHRLIIPSEHNNYRSRSIHTDMLTMYLVLAIVISIIFRSSITTSILNVLGIATDITIEKLYQLTNEERSKNGLPPLTLNQTLNTAAQQKAEDMFAKNYWAHFGPNGETPWNFILQSGYQYEHAGENLAKNFMFSDGVIQAWMNSPTHRENIVRPVYTDVGFAIVNGILQNEETTLVVQMFGTPKTGIFQQLTDTITPPSPNNQIGGVAKLEPTQSPEKIDTTPVSQIAQTVKNNPIMQSNTRASNSKNINKSIPFSITIAFMVFLFISFVIDMYVAERMGIFRLTGKHLAHALFLLTIISAVLLLKRGVIL